MTAFFGLSRVQAKAFLAELRKAESALFYSQKNTERTYGGRQFTVKVVELPRLATHFCSLRPNYPSSERLRETAQASGAATLPPMGASFVSNVWVLFWKAISARLTKDGLLSHTQHLENSTEGVSNVRKAEINRFWKITAALAGSATLINLKSSAKDCHVFLL